MNAVVCAQGHPATPHDKVCPTCGSQIDLRQRIGSATVVDLAATFTSEELDALSDEIWSEWERVAEVLRETDVEDETYEALNDELESIELLEDKVQEVQEVEEDLASAEDSHEIDLLSERLHNPETPEDEKEQIVAFFQERIKAIEIEQMKMMARPRIVQIGTWIPEEPPPGYRRSIWICVKCGNGVYEKGERGSGEWVTLPCANCGHDNSAQLSDLWRRENR